MTEHAPPTPARHAAAPKPKVTPEQSPRPGNSGLWLLTGLVTVVAIVAAARWAPIGQDPDVAQLPGDADQSPAMEMLEKRIYRLAESLEGLETSAFKLETKLANAHVITDSLLDAGPTLAGFIQAGMSADPLLDDALNKLPPPAAGESSAKVSASIKPRKFRAGVMLTRQGPRVIASVPGGAASPLEATVKSTSGAIESDPVIIPAATVIAKSGETGDTAAATPLINNPQQPATNQPGANEKKGPWVINLFASTSKDDADRFAKRALASNVQTRRQQATVKGRQYWRVQVAGFSSAAEARTHSSIVSEKLGLEGAWVMKR